MKTDAIRLRVPAIVLAAAATLAGCGHTHEFNPAPNISPLSGHPLAGRVLALDLSAVPQDYKARAGGHSYHITGVRKNVSEMVTRMLANERFVENEAQADAVVVVELNLDLESAFMGTSCKAQASVQVVQDSGTARGSGVGEASFPTMANGGNNCEAATIDAFSTAFADALANVGAVGAADTETAPLAPAAAPAPAPAPAAAAPVARTVATAEPEAQTAPTARSRDAVAAQGPAPSPVRRSARLQAARDSARPDEAEPRGVRASAEEPEQFGDAGQIMPSGSVSFAKATVSPPGGGDSESVTAVSLSPRLMFFVTNNLAIGGALSLQLLSSGDYDETIVGLAPSIGYNIRFTDTLSLMPTSGFEWSRDSVDDIELTKVTFVLSAPFLIHPSPHFFVGVGPAITYDLISSISSGGDSEDYAKATQMGMATTVGGTF